MTDPTVANALAAYKSAREDLFRPVPGATARCLDALRRMRDALGDDWREGMAVLGVSHFDIDMLERADGANADTGAP